MKKAKRDKETLSPLRRALYDAIKKSGHSQAHFSKILRGNGYFINKYLWENNPQRLPLDEGFALAKELDIDPRKILGERYAVLTEPEGSPVIEGQKGVGSETRAEKKNMDAIYELAVETLSKLSTKDMVRAVQDATELAAQEKKQRNPQSRGITS